MHQKTLAIHKNLPNGFGQIGQDDTRMRFYNPILSRRRHAHLKDAYKGETAFVLTCGPSLGEVWDDNLKDFLSDKLVISVKQAHHQAPEIFDFHMFNEVRMEPYEYPAQTNVLSVSQFLKDYPSHIHYPIHRYKYHKSLFVTHQYDRWDPERRFVRPWGVGIMFELGLQLPIYLGCKKVVIIGFDMNNTGKYHFYDDKDEEDSVHYDVHKGEFKDAPATIPHYLKWTQKKGTDVKLYSPLSALPIDQLKDFDHVKQYATS